MTNGYIFKYCIHHVIMLIIITTKSYFHKITFHFLKLSMRVTYKGKFLRIVICLGKLTIFLKNGNPNI